MAGNWVVQEVTEADLPDILALEQRAFPVPWHLDSYESALDRPSRIFLALRDGGRLVAYALSWLVVDEVHILKVATEQDYRRRGLASLLLEETLYRAAQQQPVTAWLEVRPSNSAARALYASLGFREVYVRKRYYTDNGEDAIVLAKSILVGGTA